MLIKKIIIWCFLGFAINCCDFSCALPGQRCHLPYACPCGPFWLDNVFREFNGKIAELRELIRNSELNARAPDRGIGWRVDTQGNSEMVPTNGDGSRLFLSSLRSVPDDCPGRQFVVNYHRLGRELGNGDGNPFMPFTSDPDFGSLNAVLIDRDDAQQHATTICEIVNDLLVDLGRGSTISNGLYSIFDAQLNGSLTIIGLRIMLRNGWQFIPMDTGASNTALLNIGQKLRALLPVVNIVVDILNNNDNFEERERHDYFFARVRGYLLRVRRSILCCCSYRNEQRGELDQRLI